MPKKRLGAALLSLCLLAGAAVPAQAGNSAPLRTNVLASEESGPSGGTSETPETSETPNSPKSGPDSGKYYASEAPAPGEVLLTAGEKPSIVDSGSCGDNLTWTLDSEGTLTISGTGTVKASSYNGNKSSIRSVVCEPGVTAIGAQAFQSFPSLGSVHLPDSVVQIENMAFRYCRALSGATLGNGLVSIGSYAFGGCSSLKSAVIPGSVSSMGSYAL